MTDYPTTLVYPYKIVKAVASDTAVRRDPLIELRYSLRSMQKNFLPGVERLIIVGDDPGEENFAGPDITRLEGNFYEGVYNNVAANVFAGVAHAYEHLQEEWVLVCNDDFYLMDPMWSIPLFTQGLYSDFVEYLKKVEKGETNWLKSNRNGLEYLTARGQELPLSFELHTPIPIHCETFLEALGEQDFEDYTMPQWRSLYGNLLLTKMEDPLYFWLKGHPETTPVPMIDVKVRANNRPRNAHSSYLSTDERRVKAILPELQLRFPLPSRWEIQARRQRIDKRFAAVEDALSISTYETSTLRGGKIFTIQPKETP